MDISRKDSKHSTRISISGELTIYDVSTARARLLDDSKGWPATVNLDLKGVTELDSAGVQLLLMLQKGVVAAGGQLRLPAVSEPAQQVFNTLRLGAPFTEQGLLSAKAPLSAKGESA